MIEIIGDKIEEMAEKFGYIPYIHEDEDIKIVSDRQANHNTVLLCIMLKSFGFNVKNKIIDILYAYEGTMRNIIIINDYLYIAFSSYGFSSYTRHPNDVQCFGDELTDASIMSTVHYIANKTNMKF